MHKYQKSNSNIKSESTLEEIKEDFTENNPSLRPSAIYQRQSMIGAASISKELLRERL